MNSQRRELTHCCDKRSSHYILGCWPQALIGSQLKMNNSSLIWNSEPYSLKRLKARSEWMRYYHSVALWLD